VNLPEGAFIGEETATVELGPCTCPGAVHGTDTAEVWPELPWDVLTAVGLAASAADAYRTLAVGALVSWTILDADGLPVPINATTVRRLRPDRMTRLAGAINAAYERAEAALPNGSGAPSARSRPESAPSSPMILTPGRRGRSR